MTAGERESEAERYVVFFGNLLLLCLLRLFSSERHKSPTYNHASLALSLGFGSGGLIRDWGKVQAD